MSGATFFLAVAGNIGVGKTHVSSSLAQRLGWPVYYEPVIDNPYLDPFYDDMARWAFHLQVFFLSERYKAQKRFLAQSESFIQDRTIYEDAEVFARTLRAQGDLSPVDYDTYRSLFWEMVETLRAPDLIVYLRASIPGLLERISNRGRECERSIDPEYLGRLQTAYDTWMVEARDRYHVIEVDTESPEFLTVGIERLERVIRERAEDLGADMLTPEMP